MLRTMKFIDNQKILLFFCFVLFCNIALSATHNIAVGGGGNLVFTPNNLTIATGDTVIWTNEGGFHNVASDDSAWTPDAPSSTVGWTFTLTFENPGTFGYHCQPHQASGMTGTITVEDPPPPPVVITASHRGTFFEPATSGQGVLIDINGDVDFLFMSWFTYDTAEAASKTIGSPDQRWLTAQGAITGNPLTLDINAFTGGVFDDSSVPTQTIIGQLTLEYLDCDSINLDYNIEQGNGLDPLVGQLNLVRLITTNECQDL